MPSPLPISVQTPKHGLIQIVNADASGQKTVVTAGTSGSKITSLRATSNDTSARILQVSILRSGVNYIIGSVTVPIGAGTDGVTPAVNLLNTTDLPGLPLDNDGTRYILLESGDSIQVSSTTIVTAAKTVSVESNFGNF